MPQVELQGLTNRLPSVSGVLAAGLGSADKERRRRLWENNAQHQYRGSVITHRSKAKFLEGSEAAL
jgi:hypothetical protein